MDAQVGFLDLAVDHDPIVVVGSGPVGSRTVRDILRAEPAARVVWYGDEAWQPYNRVKLSSLLAGDASWDSLADATPLPPTVDCRFGCRVMAVDRARRLVVDAAGRTQRYRHLVLATGSRPHIPAIPGVHLKGVFSFRKLDDAQRLQARTVRTRVCVVIGGGLLGLEAARAMRRHHTRVWVVEHADRLMAKQLDHAAAAVLRMQIEAMDIRVRLGEGVRAILGEAQVCGVQLRDGRALACDTVVIATGVQPNIELALACGLPVGRGIKVDDRMRTADPAVFAVGECAEHRGAVHGQAAPGLEQAAVVADGLAGGTACYAGSVPATSLKALGVEAFSIGEIERQGPADRAREIVFHGTDGAGGRLYRKLLLRRGRLVGVIGIGPWPERARVQEAARSRGRVLPWQQWRFARLGRLWRETDADATPAGESIRPATPNPRSMP